MTRVIFNLGLDDPTYGPAAEAAALGDHTMMTKDERAAAYLSRLRSILQNGLHVSLYEDTMIVTGELQFRVGFADLEGLAQCAEQDCIAAWFPDLQLGKLYGPWAEAWGEFDPQFFHMPVERRGLE